MKTRKKKRKCKKTQKKLGKALQNFRKFGDFAFLHIVAKNCHRNYKNKNKCVENPRRRNEVHTNFYRRATD